MFNLTLDDYGSETTWELVDDNNNTLASGGPYANNIAGTVKTETLTMANGCYTLIVDDSYGDGICCTYGNGSFELLDSNGSQIGFSNGNFGTFETMEFCINNNVVTTSRQAKEEKLRDLQPKDVHNFSF